MKRSLIAMVSAVTAICVTAGFLLWGQAAEAPPLQLDSTGTITSADGVMVADSAVSPGASENVIAGTVGVTLGGGGGGAYSKPHVTPPSLPVDTNLPLQAKVQTWNGTEWEEKRPLINKMFLRCEALVGAGFSIVVTRSSHESIAISCMDGTKLAVRWFGVGP